MGNKEPAPKSSDCSCLYDLIERYLPGRRALFFLIKRPNPSETYFLISSENGKIAIEGNDNVSICSGLHFYMRRFLNNSVSWCGDNLSPIPANMELPEYSVKKSCAFPFAYYLNYCTHSYTMAFWDWPRWQREIDWMALHGVNLVLAMTLAKHPASNGLPQGGYQGLYSRAGL